MSKIHNFFERKPEKWNIKDYLNECEIESFIAKIDNYIKSLKAIIERDQGERQKAARNLIDRYMKASKKPFLRN